MSTARDAKANVSQGATRFRVSDIFCCVVLPDFVEYVVADAVPINLQRVFARTVGVVIALPSASNWNALPG